MKELNVLDTKITYYNMNDEDYISLTDMLKSKDGDFFISDWLRNRNTIEFLGIWEELHNPNFNYGEFAIIKSEAGLNSYKISVKEWVNKTNSIGIVAKAGRLRKFICSSRTNQKTAGNKFPCYFLIWLYKKLFLLHYIKSMYYK